MLNQLPGPWGGATGVSNSMIIFFWELREQIAGGQKGRRARGEGGRSKMREIL